MTSDIAMPHDRFFRAAMNDLRVAKAFFQQHLPPHLRSHIDLDKLQPQKDSFVDENLRPSITDVLFSVPFDDQDSYLYVLVEHQTQAEPLMAFRLLKYLIAIMDHHLNKGHARLPLVYPLLFYTGQPAYNHSTDVFTLFDAPAELAKSIFLQPFQLVDVHRIPDETLRQDVWSSVMTLCMKHIVSRDLLPFLQDMLCCFQVIERGGGISYVQAALKYLLAAGEVQDPQQFVEQVKASLSHETGETIMTIAQQFHHQGWEQGKQEGWQQGKQEGWQQGKQAGEAVLLLRQLKFKFRSLPDSYQEKIAQADEATLMAWSERILQANTLEEIFDPTIQ